MSGNTLALLCSTVRMLAGARLTTWIFGAWAEELWHISAPREHNDIDLLYPANDFERLDRWMAAAQGIFEIPAKRFSHKRAIMYRQVMIEFLLIERTTVGFQTKFFAGLQILDWPHDTLQYTIDVDDRALNVASPAALQRYRQQHAEVQQAYQIYTQRRVG
jgi:hypothetical protein